MSNKVCPTCGSPLIKIHHYGGGAGRLRCRIFLHRAQMLALIGTGGCAHMPPDGVGAGRGVLLSALQGDLLHCTSSILI